MSDANELGYGRCAGCNGYFPPSADLHAVLEAHTRTCPDLARMDREARLRAAAPEMLALLRRAQEEFYAQDGRYPEVTKDIGALLVRIDERRGSDPMT